MVLIADTIELCGKKCPGYERVRTIISDRTRSNPLHIMEAGLPQDVVIPDLHVPDRDHNANNEDDEDEIEEL